jgi:DNA-binding PucR family transcriptional regulator
MSAVEIPDRVPQEPLSDRFIRRVAKRLIADLPDLTDELVKRIVSENSFYARAGQFLQDELRGSAEQNITQLLRGLAGLEPLDFELPRNLARRRAEQGVPVAALLHAYRLAFQVLWEHFMEAAHSWATDEFTVDQVIDGGQKIWSLTDAYLCVISQAYDDAIADRARRSERERTLLLDALLDGRTQDLSLVADVACILDLPERGLMVVVAAEVTVAGQESLPGVEQALRARAIRSAWRLRGDRQIGIVTIGPGLGTDSLDEMQAIVGSRASGRVGVSPMYRELTQTSGYVRLAAIAMTCVAPDRTGVAFFDDHPVGTLVAGSADLADRVARLVLGPVFKLGAGEQETLLGTLSMWIEEGGSVAKAGERLFCHRNTVRNRLQRIETLTGRSLADPRSLAEICVSVEAVSLRPELREARDHRDPRDERSGHH